jgi:hypothetical protein
LLFLAGRTEYASGRMAKWCQRLRVDWDVACYGRGSGDILKGLPGRAVRG